MFDRNHVTSENIKAKPIHSFAFSCQKNYYIGRDFSANWNAYKGLVNHVNFSKNRRTGLSRL